MPTRRLSWLVALSMVALSLTACAGGSETAPGSVGSGSGAPADDSSPTAEATVHPIDSPSCLGSDATTVVAGASDDPVLVSTVGVGDEVVVLAPQQGGDSCQWADQAERLAGAGYRVVLLTWATDSTLSIPAAIEVAEATGEPRFVLMGASKGGLYSAVMAAELDPAPAGVIAISPPATMDELADRQAEGTFAGPLLVIANATDTIVSSTSSRALARADDPSTYVELPAGGHGVALFEGDGGPQVEELVDTFLTKAFG